MKRTSYGRTGMTIGMIGAAVVLLIATHLCCSATEERDFAEQHPLFAPATQAIESAQSKFDPIAVKGQQAAAAVQRAADDANELGVPGAGVVALIAAAVGTALGVYNERRRGTVPLTTAVSQIVRSVEAAFPARTESQKTAMAAIQDQQTRRLVESIKTG